MPQERGERDEPVQTEERFAFHGQSASGYARQHVGNVYNSQFTRRRRRT